MFLFWGDWCWNFVCWGRSVRLILVGICLGRICRVRLIRLGADIRSIFWVFFNLWSRLIPGKDPRLIKLSKRSRNFPFSKIIVELKMAALEIYNHNSQKQCLVIKLKMIKNKV
jgi:hypothetical protein